MRIEKVEALIKHAISDMLLQEISDPRIGFATITNASLTKDLKIAKVYYSVLGSEEEKKKTAEGLKSAVGYIKKIIAQNLKLRFTPEIIFIADDSPEKAIEMDKLFEKLKEKEGEIK